MASRTGLVLLTLLAGCSAVLAQRQLETAGDFAGGERTLQSHPRRARGTQGPGLPCDGTECEATWTKCAGKAFDAVSPCCPGDICVMKHDMYAQCRPESYPIPMGWDGSILECGMGETAGSGYGETAGTGYGETAGAGAGYGETAGTGYGETAGTGYGETAGAGSGGVSPGDYGL